MITGEKTILKGLTRESASLIYKWVNQEELRALTGTVFPVSEYEHDEWIKSVALSAEKKIFLICTKNDERAIGTIGLEKFDYISRNVELFISIGEQSYISPNNQQGGYGTDAVATLVNFCFKSLNMHKVLLRVFESNSRAIRCYEKVGFKKEGTLIDHHFSNGKYENVIIMGIIAPDHTTILT